MQNRLTLSIVAATMGMLMGLSTFVYACHPDPPPPIWILSPGEGEQLSGGVGIQAGVDEKAELESVEFLVNGKSIAVVTTQLLSTQ